jgi:hypothetical protein
MHNHRRFVASSGAVLCLVLASLVADARTISLDHLLFLPPAAPTNEISLTLATDVIGTDSTATQLTGFSMADLDFQVIGTSVTPTGLTFTGGQVALSDVTFSFFFNTIQISTMGIVGSPNTPLPPGTVTNNQFDATEHEMIFDQGIITGPGTTIDLSTAPISGTGMGTGQVNILPVGTPVGNEYTFEATVSLPIEIDESVQIPDVPVIGTVNATLTGSGNAVSRQQFTIAIVPGDFNGDQFLDCVDLTALEDEVANGGSNLEFDVDMDGFVTSADVTYWLDELRMALPADANLDDFVDGVDFIVWNDHRFTATGAWCSGDFNRDGFVDAGDFIIWNENRFTSADVVPEPGTWFVWLASGLYLLFRHRFSRF